MSPATSYVRREIDAELDLLFPDLPAVSLDGPKGVGKTETALRRAASVFRLDIDADRQVVAADPPAALAAAKPILIDEWQYLPLVWDAVRRAVDADSSPSSFLLTGSASPVARLHSGAGRIVPLHMRPMTLFELGIEEPTVSLSALLEGKRAIDGSTSIRLRTYVEEILRSGFPGIRTSTLPRVVRARLDGYLERLVDHEIVENGLGERRPAALRQWLTAYAAATATTTSFEKIRDAATAELANPPAKATSATYREALLRLWILDPVEAWLPGTRHLSRLAAAPKHHLTDPALAARLLGVTADALLAPRRPDDPQPRDGALLAQLFESLVTLNVRVSAQGAEARVAHLRTRGGEHEVDLIVTGEGGRVLALETKATAAPDLADAKHLLWLKNQLGDQLIDMVLVTTGPYAYRRPDGVAVVPAALLGP